MRRFHALPVALVLSLAACTAFDRTATEGPPVAGTDWMLNAITFPDSTRRPGENASLSFGLDGHVAVRSCSTCRGLWSTYGDTLRLGPLACTRRACSAGQLELDRLLVGGSFPVEVDNNVLLIQGRSTRDERVELRFRRTVLPPTGS